MNLKSSILPRRRPGIQALSLSVVLLLSACETPGLRDSPLSLENRAVAQMQAGNYRAAAQLYERLATGAASPDDDRHLLAAAEAWYRADERNRALQAMRAAGRPYPATLSPAQTLLAAVIDVETSAPRDALARLATLPPDTERLISGDALAVGARAWFDLGNARRGVEALIQREIWVDSPGQIDANQRLIWDGLRSVGPVDVPADADEVLRGWLELGNAVADTAGDAFAERAALLRWRSAWPGHPAGEVLLRQLIDDYDDVIAVPQRVALLLPLSGRVAAAGAALRDGFIAAYYDYGPVVENMQIVVYDTELMGAAVAYERATRESADFIVGPLRKDAVAEIAALAAAGPPTLALNYLPGQSITSRHFYQYALAPEHEARRVAQRAVAEGLHNAVALVPGNEWGQRVLDAFGAELERLGGTLLTYEAYDPSANDFSTTIQPMLHLDRSRARYNALASALGRTMEFEPRRREDVDFVFMAAVARQARQIRPQLRFHYASDLPVYATASAYDPDPALNRDVDGLIFAATPWEIGAGVQALKLQAAIARYWPDRSQHRSSLFAMGYDAWRLAPLLAQRGKEPLFLRGLTGDLSLDEYGRVERSPALGRIEQGLATPLERLEVQDDDTENVSAIQRVPAAGP